MVQFSSLYTSYLDEELGTDDSTILFTTARRKSAINKGAAKFATLTQCLTRRVNVTVIAGVAEYDLNSTVVLPGNDFNDLDKDGMEYRYTDASSNVTIRARQDFLRRDIDWLNQNVPGWSISTQASSIQQNPSFYYLRSDGPQRLFGMTPTPGIGSSASAVVQVSYIAQAALMVNATDQPFSVNSSARTDLNTYHQALVHYGAYQLEKLRKDTQASQSQLQMFMGFVAQYLQDQRIKGGRQIRQARSYFANRRRDLGNTWNAWTGR